MAKKDRAVYAPGELGRLRKQLGEVDDQEAMFIAQRLGGQVGHERSEEEERSRIESAKPRSSLGQPKRRVELAADEDDIRGRRRSSPRRGMDPSDNPAIPQRANYWERVKLDKFAGQPEFEIKSPMQVYRSMFCIFTEIPDMVNPLFVKRRMPEYYKKIEVLVLACRSMLPRNNARRNEKLKKGAPLAYAIIDVLRNWDIEKISEDLAKIQGNPKNARVGDFVGILKAIYRPLYLLEKIEIDAHMRGTFKILYKLLYLENPTEAQSKFQELVRTALISYAGIHRDIRYLMYPLLMKQVSAKFFPYISFFYERRNRIMALVGVKEEEMVNPAAFGAQEDVATFNPEEAQEEKEGEAESPEEQSEEEKAKAYTAEAEKKALTRGLSTMEALFPKAGWDQLASFPDLYPYFVDTFDLKRGVINIAPSDPLQQIFIFMRILEDLFIGLRHVAFRPLANTPANAESLDAALGETINGWRFFVESSFEKAYLPRMNEYVRILEGSVEERNSAYTRKLVSELHWLKRLFFLPYYKFDSFTTPTFQRNEVTPIYSEVRNLRKNLSLVAVNIEEGNRAGGADAKAACDGIENPWEPYLFQVPNPLSKRLDALLAPKNRNNASLIFFTLAACTVLDYLLNNENSWAYSKQGSLFRSMNGEGINPLTGVDARIDAEAIFRESLKQRTK